MVTTMADLDMTKDFDYARYQFLMLYLQDFSYIFQCRGDGPIVAVCHPRPPILLGICEFFFMVTKILNISGPENN